MITGKSTPDTKEVQEITIANWHQTKPKGNSQYYHQSL
jgi:hypothetical protein